MVLNIRVLDFGKLLGESDEQEFGLGAVES